MTQSICGKSKISRTFRTSQRLLMHLIECVAELDTRPSSMNLSSTTIYVMSSSSNSDNDSGSETSTVAYSHEPFTTYQTRALDLVCTLYGSETAKSAQIARLSGGGFNRIIGITLSSDSEDMILRVARSTQITHLPVGGIEITPSAFNSQDLDLILRIPRFDHMDVAAQISLFDALRPSLPVPVIEHYDARSDNALGQAYILMRRLPGFNLHDTLCKMTTNERCQIAKQVAQLIVKIHAISLPHGIGPLSGDDTGQLRIMQFPVDPQDDEFDGTDSTKPPLMTFHSFVSTRIAELRAHAQMRDLPDKFRLKLLDRLSSAFSVLLDAYALSDSSIVLFHRDFAARNILVMHNKDKARWSISGVLDWDECEAAPLEISSVWPGWLWASDQEGEADFDENAWDPDLPVLDDSEFIKKSFVDEIETLKPGFLEMVRRTRDGCLRLVYERAREGFFSNEHVKELDQIEAAAKKLTRSSAFSSHPPLDFVIVEKHPLPDDPTPADAPPAYDATLIENGHQGDKSGFNDTKTPIQPETSLPFSAVSPPFLTAPIAAAEFMKNNKGKSRTASNNWFGFNTTSSSRTSHEIRDIVQGLLRDLVQDHASNFPAAVSILSSCADACASHGVSFSDILQQKYIAGHTPLYWAIVKRLPDDHPKIDENQGSDLLTALISYASPFKEEMITESRQACLVTSDQSLFKRLTQSPGFARMPAVDQKLLGVEIPPDEIEVEEISSDEHTFAANFVIPQFNKGMAISKRIPLEFIARGRLWCFTFLVTDPKTSLDLPANSWCISLSLQESSPPTYVDSRLLIFEAALPPATVSKPDRVPGSVSSPFRPNKSNAAIIVRLPSSVQQLEASGKYSRG